MRVAFDATSIGSGLGGDETMARALLRALLDGRADDDEVVALAARDVDLDHIVGDHLADQRVRVDRTDRHDGPRHFGWDLPRWVRSLAPAPDLLVCLTHAPLFGEVPVALMVPDLSFEHLPDAYPRRTRIRLQTLVRRQAPRVDRVLTISEFCRNDLIETYGLPIGHVHHVPLHADPPAPLDGTLVAERRRELGIDGPFLLYLGNLHPRKNLPTAIAAFQQAQSGHSELARHKLVVAGATWWSAHDADGDRRAADTAVRFLGRVSEVDREMLLSEASLLVYPSRFEGFGLPPLEAFGRGTPVVASNVTSIPEVCGDAALLVDPDDVAGMAEALASALTDEEVRKRLVEAGYSRAARYSPQLTTTALWRALRAPAAR